MKGEYREDDHDDDEHNHPTLSTLHPHPHPHPPPSTTSTPQITSSTPLFPNYPPHPHPHPHPTFLSPPHFLSPHPHIPSSKKPRHTPTSSDDAVGGGTIELSRRPRGRPPGSKNKPKPAPTILTHQPDPNMSPYILELPSGSHLTDSLTRFTRRRGHSLCVLTATGAVSNVTLRSPSLQSSTSSRGTVTFHGRYELLSLSGVVLIPTTHPALSNRFNNNNDEFTVSLSGPQGQVVGGKVAGRLVCSGTVYVVATSFDNPSYCRLPLDEEDDRVDGDGDGEGGAHVGMYSSTTEVMWGNSGSAGGSRPPQPNY